MRIIKIILLLILFLTMTSCSLIEEDDFPSTDEYLSVINCDGTNLQHLVKNANGNAKFSYDDQKIIIANNRGFWICNSDGSDYICVLDSLNAYDNYFSLSQNDESLLFVNNGRMYLFQYNNNELIKLLPNVNENVWDPSFSSDSNRIIYSTTQSDIDITTVKLNIMDIASGEITVIYENSTPNFSVIRSPIFSCDMQTVFFKYDGVNSINLMNLEQSSIATGYVNSSPLSISDNYLIFSTFSDIYSYNLNQDETVCVGSGLNPVVSRINDKIAYNSNGLIITDTINLEELNIAETAGINQSFSSDGSKIVFFGKKETRLNKNPVN